MIVKFDKSFLKSIKKLRNQSIKDKILTLIEELEKSDSLSEIKNCKKLTGYKTYFRIRIGDYRLGIEENSPSETTFIVIAHRKDIYNKFP